MKNFVVATTFLFSILSSKFFGGGTIPFAFVPPPQNSGLTPQLISVAYFSDWSGTTYGSAGMGRFNFALATIGVVDGDLLILVANLDNGSDTTYSNPIVPGFTQLFQKFYANDGQTFTASWKIASGEPSNFTGSYTNTVSGSTVMALIAVKGASAVSPIAASDISFETGAGTNTPAGYTEIMHPVDLGTDIGTSDWASLMVGYKIQNSAGATGAISGSQTADRRGLGWAGVIAIRA